MNSALTSQAPPSTAELYLELLKTCLTRTEGFEERFIPVQPRARGLRGLGHRALQELLSRRGIRLVREADVDPQARVEGRDWPTQAETMVGRVRLDNLQHCIAKVVRDGVPGDLIETGVWRGGATIFMRGALAAYGEEHRTVWVADSFQGLPYPDPQYPQDAGDEHWRLPHLVVSRQEVEANFARYDLLDEKVAFLEGWFCETLPSAPIERLAVLRLDGDMYESTIEALDALYPKLSVGGFVIVDDYGAVPGCRAAVEDFRSERGITDTIEPIDWTGVFWRRSSVRQPDGGREVVRGLR